MSLVTIHKIGKNKYQITLDSVYGCQVHEADSMAEAEAKKQKLVTEYEQTLARHRRRYEKPTTLAE